MKNYNCSVVGTQDQPKDMIANLFDLYVAEDAFIARGKVQSDFANAYPEYTIQLTIVDEIEIVEYALGKFTAMTTQVLDGR